MYSKIEVIEVLEFLELIRKDAKNNKNQYFDLPFDEFLLYVKCLNPQQYGIKIQNYIKKMLKMDSVKPKLDKGDGFKDGIYYEIKATIIGKSKEEACLDQVRLYQEDVNYIFIVIDATNFYNISYDIFLLTKEEMIKEAPLVGLSNCHQAENKNEKQEKSCKLNKNTKNYNRWLKEYYSYDLVKQLKEYNKFIKI